jgi:nitrate reductase gamma subunit
MPFDEPIETEMQMVRDVTPGTRPGPAASLVAVALGAAAVGAIAIGALAIGRLAINRLTVRKAKLATLEVDELIVRRLQVIEPLGPKP